MKHLVKKTLAGSLFAIYQVAGYLVHFREVSILAYHSISDASLDTAISQGVFRSHLTHLKSAGYTFVSLRDIVSHLDGGPLPRKAVALTFDDGYADFESAALPILDEFDAPATVFMVGDEAASRAALGNALPLLDEAALSRIRAHSRVEIGYHSRSHSNLRTLSGTTLSKEVAPPFSARYFAYPGGNYSAEAVDAVRATGYDAAFSIKPTHVIPLSDRFLLPRHVIAKAGLMSDILFYVSPAAAWYRALTRFV